MEHNTLISQMITYIENHLEENLTLDTISEKMNYSKFYLNRLFSEQVGYTICKYIQMRRLTKAAQKLIYTNEPIIKIAYEANYNSQQAFTLAFKQMYLSTPQLYRKIGVFEPKQNKKFTLSSKTTMYYYFYYSKKNEVNII